MSTARARNENKYRESWEFHINQLTHLALAADVTYDEMMEVKSRLMGWLENAAKRQDFE